MEDWIVFGELDHLWIPPGSFPESFVKIQIDLAKILQVEKHENVLEHLKPNINNPAHPLVSHILHIFSQMTISHLTQAGSSQNFQENFLRLSQEVSTYQI